MWVLIVLIYVVDGGGSVGIIYSMGIYSMGIGCLYNRNGVVCDVGMEEVVWILIVLFVLLMEGVV